MAEQKANYHIHLIEDDPEILDLIKKPFEDEGFSVIRFGDGPPFLRQISEHGLPHLAIIDLGLPSMHGFEVSAKLRELGDVPIIFISSHGEVETRIEGIKRFADDYVVKPFDARELVVRTLRVLSRFPDWSYGQGPVVRIDARLAVDLGNTRLLIGDRIVPLTPIEANLLHILLRHRGRSVSSETLIARVWRFETVYEDTLRVHMHRLRRKIEQDPRTPRYIQTERGFGYRFVE